MSLLEFIRKNILGLLNCKTNQQQNQNSYANQAEPASYLCHIKLKINETINTNKNISFADIYFNIKQKIPESSQHQQTSFFFYSPKIKCDQKSKTKWAINKRYSETRSDF
ncbi:hypothetical protein TorRG33x02_354070 [Trema orientale]|uniref:Uncharacterized protein n=1 Tax=Trema orientale TaxID=63057 RepID=A0A2P5ABT6_TREOI|nr:hypothetical protein TorRG33x02_354070 [Trema orientale]